MPSPFDTGIRLTVTPDPHRVRCDVDEFVLCPTNARADEAERVLAKVADLMRCVPDDHADLVEAVRLLVEERDRARAERDTYHKRWEDELHDGEVAARERDEARAEVERLRGLLREACLLTVTESEMRSMPRTELEQFQDNARDLIADRDHWRARAEVAEDDQERLRNDLIHAEHTARGLEAQTRGALARAEAAERERDGLRSFLAHAEADAEQAIHYAESDERAAVVAHLRAQGTIEGDEYADAIAAGEHRKERT